MATFLLLNAADIAGRWMTKRSSFLNLASGGLSGSTWSLGFGSTLIGGLVKPSNVSIYLEPRNTVNTACGAV